MIDYNVSKIARLEYEQRVRSLTRAYDHDVRLQDERLLSIWPIRSGIVSAGQDQVSWLSQQVGKLLYTVGTGLKSIGQWIAERGAENLKSRSGNENSSVVG